MNNFYGNPYGVYPQGYNSPMVPQQTQTPRPGINWVNGEEGARAFQIAPNSNVMLLDAENEGMFYIKSADNIGMCTIRTFRYSEVIDTQPQPVQRTDNFMNQYATKQELQELKDVINSLKGGRNEQSVQSGQFNRPRNNNVPSVPNRE